MKDKAENSFEGSESRGGKKIVIASMTLITVLMLAFSGCKKSEEDLAMVGGDQTMMDQLDQSVRSTSFSTVCLVSDAADYSPLHHDPLLTNAWGLTFSPDGNSWVTGMTNGIATIYDADGNTMARPVSIPLGGENGSRLGKPTASVSNSLLRAFVIPATGRPASVIFATEDGTIAAWSSGTAAVTVVDRSNVHAVYKGLAIGTRDGAWYLYATDFYNGHIDVFDARFRYMGALGGQFIDPELPDNYGPFGIRAFGEKLVITYAAHASGRVVDAPGPGRGFVSLFHTDGTFIRRLASNGRLNSPWGIEIYRPAASPDEPRLFSEDIERSAIMIGNAGDGHITVFAPDGTYMGQLMDNNMPVVIDGLRTITYRPGIDSENKIYFSAAPREGAHGMYGYLKY